MRILGVGDAMDLGSMYLSLLAQGHEVRTYAGAGAEAEHGTMAGLVPTVADWRAELGWIRQAGKDGVVIFEGATQGEVQDALRADDFQVIGGSSFGDRLENDRAFGQAVMADVGMRVANSREFQSFDDAIAFVRRLPDRYVYKPSGAGFASGRTFVGELADGADMLAYLKLQARSWRPEEPVRLILMNRLQGVEVGVGAYFNGREFLRPACIDWEHKRFFPGDQGELTGEMGTLVTYRRSEKLFNETLGRMEARLRDSGYCGYININTIVDDGGVHPLEFTCRFGYPGYAILQSLQLCGWDKIFRQLLQHDAPAEISTLDGFAVGVVLTVPPFPYAADYERLSRGLPVSFRPEFSPSDRAHVHLSEVALEDGQLITSGTIGYIMVVTGHGATAAQARTDAYDRIAKVCVCNGRYRSDIGTRFIQQDERRLLELGWL